VVLTGRVSSVKGNTITIQLDPSQSASPRPGDEAEISYAAGDLEIKVGTWRITGMEGDIATAEKVAAEGQVSVTMLAKITSNAPEESGSSSTASTQGASSKAPYRWGCVSSSATSLCVWVSFNHRLYEALYESRSGRLHPHTMADVYYYPVLEDGRRVSYNGSQLWNRFIRVPTEYLPADNSIVMWLHVTWVRQGTDWIVRMTRNARFEASASAPD
ncbi:MAG: hypothetical protein WB783_15965, partial [Arenicellales bacterium]